MKIGFALVLAAFAAGAPAQDTRTIQIREAQRTDDRTFAYFGQFKAALVARFGGDPLLSMLKFDEQEGQALVYATPASPPEHVIFQTGKWIPTDGRQFKPWAPDADPAVARFRLSAVRDASLRDKFRAHRAKAANAADHMGPVTIGYFGNPFNRLMVEIGVVSMSSPTFRMSVIAFDFTTGQQLDVDAAIAQVRAQNEAAQAARAAARKEAEKRDLRKEMPDVLAAYRRDVGTGRLMGLWVARDKVTFIQSDGLMTDYDRLGAFTKRDSKYDSIWMCRDGFDEREIDWSGFPVLVEKAMLAGNLDEEDRDHAEFSIERPRECGPVTIEVKFANYKSPQPYSAFDAKGRLLRTR
ncbi:MAG: hypothetical protein U1F41_04265 [Burkholderiales bacterium]